MPNQHTMVNEFGENTHLEFQLKPVKQAEQDQIAGTNV